jgi:hypothetical protein
MPLIFSMISTIQTKNSQDLFTNEYVD